MFDVEPWQCLAVLEVLGPGTGRAYDAALAAHNNPFGLEATCGGYVAALHDLGPEHRRALDAVCEITAALDAGEPGWFRLDAAARYPDLAYRAWAACGDRTPELDRVFAEYLKPANTTIRYM